MKPDNGNFMLSRSPIVTWILTLCLLDCTVHLQNDVQHPQLWDTSLGLLSKPSRLSHPQTQFPTRSPSSNPLLSLMEFSNSRDRSNSLASQLSQGFAFGIININKSIHITDAKPMNRIRRMELPLGSKTGLISFQHEQCTQQKDSHSHPSPRLVVMPHNSRRLHLLLRHLMPRTPTSHTIK